jgi:hypothetical protein
MVIAGPKTLPNTTRHHFFPDAGNGLGTARAGVGDSVATQDAIRRLGEILRQRGPSLDSEKTKANQQHKLIADAWTLRDCAHCAALWLKDL